MKTAATSSPSASQATVDVPEESGERATFGRRAVRWAIAHALVVMLVLFAVVFAILSPAFGSLSNANIVLLAASAPALLALGQTFVILTGGIDLSVGSTVGLSGVVAALLAQSTGGNSAVAIIAGIGIGGAVGVLNGLLVVARIPPFVATLGTMTAALGLAEVLSQGSPVSNLAGGFLAISTSSPAGIPLPILIMVACFAVLWFVAARTRYGMHVYAVGGNPLAARIAGVRISQVTFSVYLLGGLLAGLAGVILASRATAGIATTGSGYELDAIAAAVIGGVSLAGGRGSLGGTAVGVLIIAMLSNGMDIVNVDPFSQQIITGALIVSAVLMNVLGTRREEAA
jgi:ribose transport system permease protein